MTIGVRAENFTRELSQYNRTGRGTRRRSRSTTINTGHLERLQSQLRRNKYERKKRIHQKHQKPNSPKVGVRGNKNRRDDERDWKLDTA